MPDLRILWAVSVIVPQEAAETRWDGQRRDRRASGGLVTFPGHVLRTLNRSPSGAWLRSRSASALARGTSWSAEGDPTDRQSHPTYWGHGHPETQDLDARAPQAPAALIWFRGPPLRMR